MGLFDRRPPEPDPTPVPQNRPQQAALPETATSQAQPTPKATKPVQQPPFGIQRAIDLMRKLPPDNVELVVSVVKATLESAQVNVESIIEDAVGRRRKISERIELLRNQIKDFEDEIAGRKTEISGMERDYAETTDVQEKLELALDIEEGRARPRPAGAKGITQPKKQAVNPKRPTAGADTPTHGVPKATGKNA